MNLDEIINRCRIELVSKFNQAIEDDLKQWIEQGYAKSELSVCFYRHEPYHYSIRVGNRILADRWMRVEFLVNGK